MIKMVATVVNIEEVWLEYQHALRRFLKKKVANSADVEDLMQEIFIKTHKNLHLLNDISKLKSWLFQIANNTIIDFYRARRKQHEIPESLITSDNEESVQQDLIDCLTPFIQHLPEPQRALLIAVDLENAQQKVLAEHMGIHYSTLKSRVQTSRKALRELFDECCHFEFDTFGRAIDYQRKSCNNIKPKQLE